jgi:saccharopine dehydrogenase-like NADP-dependent oxidoreductase
MTRAAAFCEANPDLELHPVEIDRTADLSVFLAQSQPWLVVDAAGPFQGDDYRIARSCISARCHYLDLADAREFVCGVTQLDQAAREAGVCIVSGASSVPALTSAAADRLAQGLDRVSLIDIALTASNRASGSSSVTAAILSYVGKPIRLWRGGQWRTGHGWQELRKIRFESRGAGRSGATSLCARFRTSRCCRIAIPGVQPFGSGQEANLRFRTSPFGS